MMTVNTANKSLKIQFIKKFLNNKLQITYKANFKPQ